MQQHRAANAQFGVNRAEEQHRNKSSTAVSSSSRSSAVTQQRGIMRPGQFKAYTFRFTKHVPSLRVVLSCSNGALCMYASNCASRPRSPAMCKWAALVQDDGEREAELTVQTNETHYIQGVYHIGLYCFREASFVLSCFEEKVAAEPGPLSPPASTRSSQNQHAAATCVAGDRKVVHKRHVFVGAGSLEQAILARKNLRESSPTAKQVVVEVEDSDEPFVFRDDKGRECFLRAGVPHGDEHHQKSCGAWHQQFRVNLKEDQHPGGMHDVSPAVLSGQELALPSVIRDLLAKPFPAHRRRIAAACNAQAEAALRTGEPSYSSRAAHTNTSHATCQIHNTKPTPYMHSAPRTSTVSAAWQTRSLSPHTVRFSDSHTRATSDTISAISSPRRPRSASPLRRPHSARPAPSSPLKGATRESSVPWPRSPHGARPMSARAFRSVGKRAY